MDNEELACNGIKILLEQGYSNLLKLQYKLDDSDFDMEYYDILEKIGRKRGCLISGGNVDMSRAAKIFLDDIKNGKIGLLILEKVGDVQ